MFRVGALMSGFRFMTTCLMGDGMDRVVTLMYDSWHMTNDRAKEGRPDFFVDTSHEEEKKGGSEWGKKNRSGCDHGRPTSERTKKKCSDRGEVL